MTDDHDPIRIRYSSPFDGRLADLVVTSDNSPSSNDGSISLAGYVAFGTRRQKGVSGRTYNLDIKTAFLSFTHTGCRFQPNSDAQRVIQDGDFTEEIHTERGIRRTSNVSGSASSEVLKNKAKGSVSASAARRSNTSISHRKNLRYEYFITRWKAGGCSFGSNEQGNPLNSHGFLQGLYLENVSWGRLIPLRSVLSYTTSFELFVPRGGLSVRPEDKRIVDLAPNSGDRQKADAFEALKIAVASWSIEEELIAGDRNGYDNDRDEIVLATGHIDVQLSELPIEAVDNINRSSDRRSPYTKPKKSSAKKATKKNPSVASTPDAAMIETDE